MNQPNQSELRDFIKLNSSVEEVIENDEWRQFELNSFERRFIAYINAEIAKVLDRLEANIPALEDYACADCEWTGGKHSLGCCGADMNYWRLVSAIQAERARLKEVK